MDKDNLKLRLEFLKELEQKQQDLMDELPDIILDNEFMGERESVCYEISKILQELDDESKNLLTS